MFKKILAIVVLMFGASAGLEASDVPDPLAVVPSVDLSRYAGKWYEIARLPNHMDDTIYDGIVTRIAESGFESSRLLRTRQSV
jgi:apolipoprotein D and lipocalin family protein